MTTSLPATFNQQLSALFKLIQDNLPGNEEISKAAAYMDNLRRTNPRISIFMWKKFVAIPYGNEIRAGNIEFFLTKDYESDLSAITAITERDKQKIVDVINNGIRAPMRELYASRAEEICMRMQTLVNLADAYTP